MKISINDEHIAECRDELLAVGLFQDQKRLSDDVAAVDKACGGMIKKVVSRGDFKAKPNQTFLLYPQAGLKTSRLLLVGLGKKEEYSLDRLREAGAGAARFTRDMGLASLCLPVSFGHSRGFGLQERVRAILEGMGMGLYVFREYKSSGNDNGNNHIKRITMAGGSPADMKVVRAEIKRAECVVQGVCLARDLVSHPGNSATPRYLASVARSMAKKYGLACKVLDEKQAEKLGMGSFLSVAQGTDEPARFIVLEHRPRLKKNVPTVVLIGKAITFDSGGISLKPAANMEEMKYDMSGGAAVLGAMQTCARMRLPLHVVGLVPSTENLPSGHALKPGDVVTAMSGKTIEIISTDAEGRLVLADALSYSRRYKPDAIVDLATLTGACVIALGNDATAVMGNDQALVDKLCTAGEATGDRVWQLPLWDCYGELIKSDIADLKNVGGRPAGTITAGCFLREFVPENTAWAHMDIAGTAWSKKNRPHVPKGATGVGVRLLIHMLEKWQS